MRSELESDHSVNAKNAAPDGDQLLRDALAEAFDKASWHGPNLRASLRGVTAEQAVWRPAPERHNIRELAVHAAYWKYAVRRKLTGEKRGSFALQGSNFFARPVNDGEAAWRADIALLESEHRKLLEAVDGLPPAAFADPKKVRLIR